MLAPDFSVLLLQVMERDAATSPPLGKSGDNLALAPLCLAVLSGVMHRAVISSKQGAVLLPRDLSGVMYKEITLLQA